MEYSQKIPTIDHTVGSRGLYPRISVLIRKCPGNGIYQPWQKHRYEKIPENFYSQKHPV